MIPLRDSQPSGKFPILTILLIAVNIFVFYLEATTPDLDLFFHKYALIPRLVNFSEPATLLPFITSMFLHGGFLHLASNMIFLWVFGDNVEDRFGLFYIPVYLAGGIIGSLTQYYFSADSIVPVVGASGAIATILGAYLIFFPSSRITTLIFIFIFITVVDIPAIAMLAYWFFLQVFNSFAALHATVADAGGVAYFAHIGGFIFGVVTALLFGGRRDTRQSYV